jgi:hypothetical protein
MNPRVNILKIISLFTILLTACQLSYAEDSRIRDAFIKINTALYEIEETNTYCNWQHSQFAQRNNDAYDNWEYQYSFFLKDFDTNYLKWKRGFSDLQQQQFAILEAIKRDSVNKAIAADYKEGGRDKCFTFKPALSRPRNNIELTFQDEVELIRERANASFSEDRPGTGAHELCEWQQQHAIKVSEAKSQGADEKSQKASVKQFKKSEMNISKDERKARINAYERMVKDIYDLPQITHKTFSQFNFAVCEREVARLNN